MVPRFVAAAVQLCAGPDKEANLAAATAGVTEAARRGAALVALPEMFAWRGTRADEAAAAEAIPGPTSDRLAALARELGVILVGGSLLERSPDPRRYHNTCTVYGRDGALLARYRKVHLF